jgi:hypothetical protein
VAEEASVKAPHKHMVTRFQALGSVLHAQQAQGQSVEEAVARAGRLGSRQKRERERERENEKR